MYKRQLDGQAGVALYFFNSSANVNISNSTIKGGKGKNEGYDAHRIGDGINQAAGGAAIDSLNSSFNCNIVNSEVKGGDSDLYLSLIHI